MQSTVIELLVEGGRQTHSAVPTFFEHTTILSRHPRPQFYRVRSLLLHNCTFTISSDMQILGAGFGRTLQFSVASRYAL